MAFEEQIAELRRRREQALAMGSSKRLAEWTEAGILNARQRIKYLADDGSFAEYGLLAVSEREEDRHRTPGDGVIDGHARVDGRPVIIHAADFSAMGASSATIASRKLQHSIANANKNGLPLVGLAECSGARMPDIMGAQGIHRAAERGSLRRYRRVPWATAVLGQSFGGGTWLSVMSDFLVMRKGAIMAVSSTNVTTVAIAEDEDPEALGGWRMQTEVTGQVDRAVDSDEEALDCIRQFLSYLPSHSGEAPPRLPVPAGSGAEAEKLLEVVPESRAKVYDVRQVIRLIVDRDSFFPIKDRFSKVVTTGLARIDGRSVGLIATNPMFKGGAMDADACDKVISFLVLCDSFNIPAIHLVDTPGFLVGVVGERQKLPGKIMNYIQAMAMTTVPLLTVIMRKSYGQAHLNIGAVHADEMCAWYTGDISFVDPKVSVNVVHRLQRQDDPERYDELERRYQLGTSPYDLAEPFMVQDVIDPRETRQWLTRRLDLHDRRLNNGVGEHLMATWPTTF
ncbi:MAG: carboxyl transferase domain-containing protein [Alphaproteobacteria bacterium]|nr:carboxyl transferase domain-containing protein [Alphaproteobacteria bacterium]MDP6815559.1 carboxyl transferase domain-containing protein [Alphaproteobacteria bacterium]